MDAPRGPARKEMRRLLQLYWLVVCVGWPTSIGGLRPTAQNDWPAESDWVALPNQHGHFRHHQHRYGAGHDVLPHAQQFLWPQETDMCYDPRCSCHWTLVGYNVTCHCSPQDQEAVLQVGESSLPTDVALLAIDGCRDVVFREAALKKKLNLSDVTVVDVGRVIFDTGSVSHVQAELNPSITVGRCREIVVRRGAFGGNQQQPISFSVQECHRVHVEESAFSRVQRIVLSSVHQLELDAYAFRFSGAAASGTADISADITIQHATLEGFKGFTFPSPLHRLTLVNVTAGHWEPNATSALRIVHLLIQDSALGNVSSNAFSAMTHLDTFELVGNSIERIARNAVRSASSFFSMRACRVGRMEENALDMPVARVLLRDNHIASLGSASLHLREWNDLLVENNTLLHVERHAFYHIGEPQVLQGQGQSSVHFVVRQNDVLDADVGAFLFSARAHKLRLEDNSFRHRCDCNLAAWAADLTQINQRTATLDHPVPAYGEALWLGSTLFNGSWCWLASDEAECLDTVEGFVSMRNYTTQWCPRRRDIDQCLARLAALAADQAGQPAQVAGQTPTDSTGDAEQIQPVGLSSQQDMILVIVVAVLVAVVLIGVLIGLLLARRRTKLRREDGVGSDQKERVTCSPLLGVEAANSVASTNAAGNVSASPDAAAGVDKHLGGGVVACGSISRLTVKEYRNYLDELGPIYSEPSDPPHRAAPAAAVVESDVPPAVPAIPAQWTAKSSAEPVAILGGKTTIDRGTQTLVGPCEPLGPAQPSVAQEFTDDVLAALKETLDVSPTYSQVHDSILQMENETAAPLSSEPGSAAAAAVADDKSRSVVASDERGLYDVIRVVDSVKIERPSTSSEAPSDHIYCHPWNARESVPSSQPQSPSSDDSPLQDDTFAFGAVAAAAEPAVPQPPPAAATNTKSPLVKNRTSPTAPSEGDRSPAKQQPFYIRGSLPKWPPPVKHEVKWSARPARGSPSPTKDVRPPWRTKSPPPSVSPNRAASSQPTSHFKQAGKASTGRVARPAASAAKTTTTAADADAAAAAAAPPQVKAADALPVPIESDYSNPHDHADGEYAEVIATPFSFSFRRPLFPSPSRADGSPVAPEKPARTSK